MGGPVTSVYLDEQQLGFRGLPCDFGGGRHSDQLVLEEQVVQASRVAPSLCLILRQVVRLFDTSQLRGHGQPEVQHRLTWRLNLAACCTLVFPSAPVLAKLPCYAHTLLISRHFGIYPFH